MGGLETAHSTSNGLADENAEIVCENVQLMFDELQKASDVLAEMTALYEDVRRDKQTEPEIECNQLKINKYISMFIYQSDLLEVNLEARSLL